MNSPMLNSTAKATQYGTQDANAATARDENNTPDTPSKLPAKALYINEHDAIIADLLVKKHGENLIYDTAKKQWRVFIDGVWIEAEAAERAVTQQFYWPLIVDIAAQKYFELGIGTSKWLTKSMNQGTTSSVLKIVKILTAKGTLELDTDHNLIGIQNQVYDINNTKARPAAAADLVFKSVGTTYEPTATCQQWEQFLNIVMKNDQEMIGYLQRLVGYFLTASTTEQEIYYLYGTGANGKSTFLDLVKTLLGSYSVKLSSDSFMKKRSGTLNLGAQASLAMLAGARLAITDETGESDTTFNAQMLKSISGDDEVTGRFLRSNPITFKSTAKLVMYGNDKPYGNINDEGFWRRFRFIHFGYVVPKADRDPNLLEKLKDELPGILNWALKGLSDWQEYGLKTPQKILDECEQYRVELDSVTEFLKENTVEKLGSRLPIKLLFERYNEWCETNLKHPEPNNNFSKRARWYFDTHMKGKVKPFRTNKDRGYEGIQLC